MDGRLYVGLPELRKPDDLDHNVHRLVP
jgi:hypothetical protein